MLWTIFSYHCFCLPFHSCASPERSHSGLLRRGCFPTSVGHCWYCDWLSLPALCDHLWSDSGKKLIRLSQCCASFQIQYALHFVFVFSQLVNRHKNSKKQPTPLTEDMLNELNKNHMGGLENYGADDLYNMEDVWNDRPYDKPPKKVSSPVLSFHFVFATDSILNTCLTIFF